MSKVNKEHIVAKVYAAIEKKDFDVPELKKFKLNENKYPRNIIDALRNMAPKEKNIFIDEFKHVFNENNQRLEINKSHLDSSFSKLLYLMVWKQGDLDKFNRIVEGLQSSPKLEEAYENVSKAFVFFQLGRHIIFDEPIVDQHSIRAFVALIENKHIKNVRPIDVKSDNIKNSLYSKKHKDLIKAYIDWWAKKSKDIKDEDQHLLDNLMYSLGKYLKTEVKT
jgi:hypothetical protein